jgi:hypothetical protein
MLGLCPSSGVLELTKELIKTIKNIKINSKQNGTFRGWNRPAFSGSDNESLLSCCQPAIICHIIERC